MPDAWDDDWIAKADTSMAKSQSAPSSTKVSKAERRAKQAEFNRQLWEDAEDPQDNFFLKSRDIVPLKSEFKPAMQVLSRKPKPKPKAALGGDLPLAIGQLGIEDDDNSEDDAKKITLTPQERQEKAAREREEKQKKYEEVRQKLFGNEETPTPSSASPAKKDGNSRNQSRNNKPARDSRRSSSASNKIRQLYDPNDTGKPGASTVLKKETSAASNEVQPIRNPKGPDNSGRGGFGFAPRGGRPT